MRGARRGQYLRFEPELFESAELTSAASPKRYSSQQVRQAFQRFLANRKTSPATVPLPRDAIVDEAYLNALQILNSEDSLSESLEGAVNVDPDDIA